MNDTVLVLDVQKEPRLCRLLKPLLVEEADGFCRLMCSLISSDRPYYLHVHLLIDEKMCEFLIPHSAVVLVARGALHWKIGVHATVV
jgi:hypothetical protein